MVGLSKFLPLVLVNVQTVTVLLKKIPFSTWALGFLALLIYQALDTGLNNFLEILFRSPNGTPNWVWFVAAISVLINVLFPVAISFWLLSSLKTHRNWSEDFQQLFIETLRVWGQILLFTLAFLIPGLWKWISSIFVPYVVLFSKKYQTGHADALRASREIFKKVWFQSASVLIIFSLVIPYFITTSLDQYREIWVHPVGALIIGLVDYISLLISLFFLMHLFIKTSREVKNELIF